MPINQSYINTIIQKGKDYIPVAMGDYYDYRTKGRVNNAVWIEIGCLEAFVKVLDGYIIGGVGFCIDDIQAEQIAQNIKDIISRLSADPVTFETYYLLQENGFSLLTEDGYNLLWI